MASVEDRFWSGFNPTNMSQKHRDRLMNDVYSGYKTRSVSVRGRRGKYGYGKSTTKEVPFYDYYNGRGWDEVGRQIGIKNVNSTDEIRRLYDYMHGYKPQAPKAAPAPAPKPAAPKVQQQSDFSRAAAALMKTAEASLAALNKPAPPPPPAEKLKILTSQASSVDAKPLQIGPSAPPPQSSGVDSFKRKKPATNPMKILTQNALNI